MKAPNGKPSNLTERQWLTVRTKAFKNWFGDWENDPENASKVVDENGEPRVMYHGPPTAGNELLIGRALFRFPAGDKQAQFQGGQTTNNNATSTASDNGKAPYQTLAKQPASVNIYDVKILDRAFEG